MSDTRERRSWHSQRIYAKQYFKVAGYYNGKMTGQGTDSLLQETSHLVVVLIKKNEGNSNLNSLYVLYGGNLTFQSFSRLSSWH